MLWCNVKPDTDGVQSDLTVILPAGSRPAALRECLARLRNTTQQGLRVDVVVLIASGQKEMSAAALEFSRPNISIHIYERGPGQTLTQQINNVADDSEAPFLLFLDEGVLLPSGWDAPMLEMLKPDSDVAAAVPVMRRLREASDNPVDALRVFLIKRRAFVEGLGLSEESQHHRRNLEACASSASLAPAGSALPIGNCRIEARRKLCPDQRQRPRLPGTALPCLSATDQDTMP